MSVKTGKGFCKAVWGVIAVFHGKFHDRDITGDQFFPCKSHPAVSYIFRYGIPAQYTEALVKIERRNIDVACHFIHRNIFRDMLLHIFDCLTDCFCPFHDVLPPAVADG